MGLEMDKTVFWGLMIPFIGTSLGSASVLVLKNELGLKLQRILQGFAGGVMVAASIWSLIIPSLEQSEAMGKLSFIPAAVGFALGIAFLLLLDSVIPHMHLDRSVEGGGSNLSNSIMMLLAVTLHNIPEGMAVGVVYAAYLSGTSGISAAAALSLALGIAIQNFPEGAIISMPLNAQGESKIKSFWYGVLSGDVEPVFGFLTILFLDLVVPVLPYLLSFAAGAMMYVVVEELIPEMNQGEHSNAGTISFATGFLIMMILDVALG